MHDRSPILQEEIASCLKEMKLYDGFSPKFETVINRIVDWCLEQPDILQHLPRDTARPQNYFRFCIKHESFRSVGVFLAVYPREDTVAKLEVCQDSLRAIPQSIRDFVREQFKTIRGPHKETATKTPTLSFLHLRCDGTVADVFAVMEQALNQIREFFGVKKV